jgi:hypothetical protein
MIFWVIFLASFVLGNRRFKLDVELTAKNMGSIFDLFGAFLEEILAFQRQKQKKLFVAAHPSL